MKTQTEQVKAKLKEIEEEKKIFETLDINAQKRLRKEFERVTKSERLVIIELSEATLSGMQTAIKSELKFLESLKFCADVGAEFDTKEKIQDCKNALKLLEERK